MTCWILQQKIKPLSNANSEYLNRVKKKIAEPINSTFTIYINLTDFNIETSTK